MRLPGISKLLAARDMLLNLRSQLDAVQISLGRIEARQTSNLSAGELAAAEFKVSSQWGEDGIIEHLLRHVPITNPTFIEFGVQDYVESNTRFLLQNRNWSGLTLDGSAEHVAKIRQDPIYWRYNLKAHAAFVTRENINDLISAHGISGDIGLLSVDIDGNDYWIWEAIKVISPRIVIVEYNAIFGSTAEVSVPYDPDFVRSRAHYSNRYWGCSIAALDFLASRLGYALIGCNSNGNNSFFIRNDLAAAFPKEAAREAFRAARFRESRGADGKLNYLSNADAIRQISKLPLVDVRTGQNTTVAEAAGPTDTNASSARQS